MDRCEIMFRRRPFFGQKNSPKTYIPEVERALGLPTLAKPIRHHLRGGPIPCRQTMRFFLHFRNSFHIEEQDPYSQPFLSEGRFKSLFSTF